MHFYLYFGFKYFYNTFWLALKQLLATARRLLREMTVTITVSYCSYCRGTISVRNSLHCRAIYYRPIHKILSRQSLSQKSLSQAIIRAGLDGGIRNTYSYTTISIRFRITHLLLGRMKAVFVYLYRSRHGQHEHVNRPLILSITCGEKKNYKRIIYC